MKSLYKNETVAKATVEMVASWKGDDEAVMQAAAEKWSEAIFNEIRNDFEVYGNDRSALAARGYRQLTNEETEFYNALAKRAENFRADDPALSDILPKLPVTIINDIYRNLVNEHPLLNAIRFQNVGYSTKIVLNNHTAQNAAWGAIPASISQEITSGFRSIDLTLAKLSCYAVLPLDLVRMGATFLDQYVRTIITEAMACKLEAGIVTGTGKNMPIGMDRKVDSQAVVVDGVYAQKSAVAVTDFTPASYGALIASNLLTADNGVVKSSFRNLGLICNPIDYFTKIMPATTVLNAAGQYIGNLFPVPTQVIPSGALSQGDAILGFLDEYVCGIGAPVKGAMYVSDEFKFLDDARTFKTLTYANGRAYDNSSFVRLDVSGLDPAFLNVKMVGESEDGPEGATGATGATGVTA